MLFENIFSKKPEKQEEKPLIIIDTREKNSLVPAELVENNIQIEFRHLPVGDYLINGVAIERKTINDLKSSIINKRIFFQLKEIKQFPKHLLIIEGFQENNIYQGILHENAVRGFILSTLLEAQVPIVFTQNEKDSARYLSVLAKKEPKKDFALRQKIPLNEEEEKQFILEGFPGIGPTTAKKLLEKFKSIRNVIDADEKDLEKILGKKADKFKKALD